MCHIHWDETVKFGHFFLIYLDIWISGIIRCQGKARTYPACPININWKKYLESFEIWIEWFLCENEHIQHKNVCSKKWVKWPRLNKKVWIQSQPTYIGFVPSEVMVNQKELEGYASLLTCPVSEQWFWELFLIRYQGLDDAFQFWWRPWVKFKLSSVLLSTSFVCTSKTISHYFGHPTMFT